jgi:hypothetical protein
VGDGLSGPVSAAGPAGEEWSTLVLRMDGVDTEQGTIFPVSTFAFPSPVAAFATTSEQDSVLAVGAGGDGVLEAGELFAAGNGLDFDAPVADSYRLISAPLLLGDKSVVRRVRVRYSHVPGISSPTQPYLAVSVMDGPEGGDYTRVVAGQVDLEVSDLPVWVAVDLDLALEASLVTVKIEVGGYDVGTGPADIVLHALEVDYRAWGGA